MSLLALIASALSMLQAPASEQAVQAPQLIVFHPNALTGAEEQIILVVVDAVGAGARASVREDSDLWKLAGGDAGRDKRLQAYHAMRQAAARGTWTLSFVRSEGVATIEAFDDEQGVRALRGVKIRSMAREQLSDEHLARLEEAISVVQRELVTKTTFLASSRQSSYRETIAWPHPDAPPHPGFRWVFGDNGPRVTYVYEFSSIQQAGLQVGDQIATINDMPVPSPPHLGRALGPLRAGDELRLAVLRQGASVDLVGKVESSAELIPRWQAGIVGKKALPLAGPVGATAPALSELQGPPVLVVVHDPAMPDTRGGFAVLRWIRDHYRDEELDIQGVAVHADDQTLARFLDQVRPGWPSVPDPDGRLTDALRVYRPPAYLLIDGRGVLRFRQVDEALLTQAIETLRVPR